LFFAQLDRVTLLRAEADAWLGTPYYPFSRAKGQDGGVDCLGLTEALYIACGLAREGDFVFPRTAADYQSHRAELRVLKYLRGEIAEDPQSARLVELFEELPLPEERKNIDVGRFLPGDMIALRQAGQFHLPIYLGNRFFVHCLRPLGVVISDLHDPTYATHFDAHFRPRALPA
jgi:cell wall-associated NlpC family hydrolase